MVSLFKLKKRLIEMDLAPFDVFPDGERFMVLEQVAGAAIPPLTLVQNWTAELEK